MTFEEWIETELPVDVTLNGDYWLIEKMMQYAWNAALENQWVSVKDRRPSDDRSVFVLDKYEEACVGIYTHGIWSAISGTVLGCNITHWMEITLPKSHQGD